MIKIQINNFDIELEIQNIKKNLENVGAVSTFIGFVKNTNNNKSVNSIELDVYKKMAEKYLSDIIIKAKSMWNINEALIIHRYGKLNVGEKIVLVATFSSSRDDAAHACEFIMDYLKKAAPFWKKENYNNESTWLTNTN